MKKKIFFVELTLILAVALLMQPVSAQEAPHLNDAWELDLTTNTWNELAPTGSSVPEARRFSPHAYDSQRNRLIIAGGQGDGEVLFSDAWALDLIEGSESWNLLSTTIPHIEIAFHGGVYDSKRELFVVIHSSSHIDVLDLSSNSWSTPSTTGIDPQPVIFTTHSVTYDVINDRYVLFGGGQGGDPEVYTNRVRVLDANTLTWSDLSFPATLPVPSARSLASTVYDANLERVLLFGGAFPGGFGAGISLDDTWQLTLHSNSETWTQFLSRVAPLDRAQQATAFDTNRQQKIMFGGLHYFGFASFAGLNDVWFFDGTNWINPFPSGPRPISRRGASASYDTVNDRFIVFGGQFISVFATFIDGLVNITPETLNLKSQGRWLGCCIALPDGFNVADIDVSTVSITKINQDDLDPPLLADQGFGGKLDDCDGNLIPDLTIKFDLQEFIGLLPSADELGITIEGELTTGDFFSGSDVIRTVGSAINKDFAEEDKVVIPEAYALYQNHPNPFNPTTTIPFVLPEATEVKLSIYDINGREVRRLISGNLEAGIHDIQWDATDHNGVRVASGIYIYRLQAGSFIQTRKMTLLK